MSEHFMALSRHTCGAHENLLSASEQGCASSVAVAVMAGATDPQVKAAGDMPKSRVDVISRRELADCRRWPHAFAAQYKDGRYYEIVEDTLHPEFQYLYFAIRNLGGEITAVQPFFIHDQDILAGLHPRFGWLIDAIRRRFPRFMRMKALMVGCVAGEGHLDGDDDQGRAAAALSLSGAIVGHARGLGARLIVLKEFPDEYRDALSCFAGAGFTRIPSMPYTRLGIAYADFDDYMERTLNSATRRKLRKKFKAADGGAPITLSVTRDIMPAIDEIFPLYLQVYERSKLHFEKLTPAYFRRLGEAMPDRARFFMWRRNGRAVAFVSCLVHDDTLHAEYLGLDYTVALDLHLYHYVFRDLVRWGIANGCRWFQSSGLNYDPKLHLRQRLKPVDLYVRHTSNLVNAVMRKALPWLEPTRHDETLKKFPNYADLWGAGSGAGKSRDAAGERVAAAADLRKGWGPP